MKKNGVPTYIYDFWGSSYVWGQARGCIIFHKDCDNLQSVDAMYVLDKVQLQARLHKYLEPCMKNL